MEDFIDIHSHIICGIDDGPQDMSMSLRMLKIAAENGIGQIILTPHNKPGRHNAGRERICSKIAELEQLSAEQEIFIKFHIGNELYYRSELAELIADGKAMTLAESSYILTEFGPMDDYDYIRNGMYQLMAEGYRVILAHGERYGCLTNRTERFEELTGMGAYIQLNAGSITGACGFQTKSFCKQLLKRELVHFVATDAHDDRKRAPYLGECAAYLEKKYGKDYAKLLLHDNPARVLANKIV